MNIKCVNCLQDFRIKPSRLARNPLYCSMDCRKSYAINKECLHCFTKFRNIKSGKIDRKYCSHKCYINHKVQPTGEDHHKWTTGITAYRRIAKHLKLHGCKLCSEHSNTEIHHIDGNRENNNVDNLVCLCRKCHKLTHWGKTSLSQFLPKITCA